MIMRNYFLKKIYRYKHYYFNLNIKMSISYHLLHYGIILKEQDYFGEEPLKYDTLHEYSAFCVTDVHLFILDKEFYNMLLLEKVTKSEKRM